MLSAAGTAAAREFGVYLHIPFCAERCDYCAFATWTGREDDMERYVAAVRREIEVAISAGMPAATTVFVGGGTPSLLPPRLIAELLAAVPVAAGAEITVECNPESTSATLLDALRGAGATRISLGVQSMVPHVLGGLGRHHGVGTVERAVGLVRGAGFETFNLDLVYGGAGERDEDWAATLDAVLALEPPHVSAYALTVEAGTPLARDASRHPDDDVQADRYLAADERLAAEGLFWYELSNFARPGHECRHNRACWAQADYQGFGCAAHSHRDGVRSANIRSLDRYLAAVEKGSDPVASRHRLDADERELERQRLALRTCEGVLEAWLPEDPALVGLVERRAGKAMLTARGRLLANEVALRLEPPRMHGCDTKVAI